RHDPRFPRRDPLRHPLLRGRQLRASREESREAASQRCKRRPSTAASQRYGMRCALAVPTPPAELQHFSSNEQLSTTWASSLARAPLNIVPPVCHGVGMMKRRSVVATFEIYIGTTA